MKKILLLLFGCFSCLLASGAYDFKYTYEGTTLEYKVLDEESKTCKVSSYSKLSEHVVIPEIANGYAVKGMVFGAFWGVEKSISILVPSSMTTISPGAFCNCYGLASVYLPSSVDSIGKSAFSGCKNLKNITIPASVTFLGSNVFDGCSSLTAVRCMSEKAPSVESRLARDILESAVLFIPQTATGYNAFSWMSFKNIEKFDPTFTYSYMGQTLTYYVMCEKTCAVVKHNGNIPEQVVIPSQAGPYAVSKIGTAAFKDCESLLSVDIPSTVWNIEDNAFGGCAGLSSIAIPSAVKTIGNYAFSGCN